MKILHIADIKNPNGNGVAHAIKEYLKYEKKYCKVALYCLGSDIQIEDVRTYSNQKYKYLDELPDGFNKPDLIIFNEVYKKEFLKKYKECKKLKIPYIIIPHGCLVKEAQNSKKTKKIIANFLFFNKFISQASAIQFLNENEKDKTNFKYKKYIISGNGTGYFVKECNKHPKNKNIVYIGRYSIHCKGLDMLLKACFINKKWFLENDIKIEMFGRTSGNDLNILKKEIEKKELNDVIKINDAIYNEEKNNVLNETYAFIQTSRHEGQPMGIIEAMAYGIPCIVTTGTTFADIVNDNKCGYGVNFDDKEIFEAIKQMCENENERNLFAENSLSYCKKNFDWKNIIKKLIPIYKTIEEEKNEKNN